MQDQPRGWADFYWAMGPTLAMDTCRGSGSTEEEIRVLFGTGKKISYRSVNRVLVGDLRSD